MSTVQKIILSFLLSLFLFTSTLSPLLVSSASAQTTWYNQDFKSWYNRVYGSPSNDVFGERYTAAQVEWIIYGLFAFLINGVVDPQVANCFMNPSVGNCVNIIKGFFHLSSASEQNLAIQTPKPSVANYILLEDRPLSGITYFRDVARNWHIIPQAKAQGFGFTTAFEPVLPLWKASRNVAYGVLVLAILILAFMVMFRVKINPQTAITVQSAIPKVVIALILITFSYAIAGFMVDLMYVVIGLVSWILSQAYSSFGASVGVDVFFGLMTQGPANTGILGSVGAYSLAFTIALIISILGSGGIIAGLPFGVALSLLLGIILIIILFIVLLVAAIKIIWMLLKAFVITILLVAVAPLQIALGIVVQGVGFGSWLKSFLSNLSVFPVTGFFLSMAFLFLYVGVHDVLQKFSTALPLDQLLAMLFANIPIPGAGLVSTFINQSGGWPPLLGSQNAMGLIYALVSLVILLMTPKVSDIIKAVIEGKPFEYGTAIGQAFGPVTGVAGFGVGVGREVGQTYLFGRIRGAMPARIRQYLGRGQVPPEELEPGSAPNQ